MYSSAAMRQKTRTKQETCITTEEPDSFHDKRRLLSYWNSLDTCPVSKGTDNDVDSGLLIELKSCLAELDNLDSLSNTAEQDTTMLLNEQLSLLKQLGEYSVHVNGERGSHLDFNDNLKNSKKNHDVQDELKAEIELLLGKNGELVNQLAKQSEEHKSAGQEQQRDIEKLTREVQNFSISRRKLERELLQMTKQKNEHDVTVNSLRQDMKTTKDSYEAEIQKLSNMNDQASQENNKLVEKGREAAESLKITIHQLTEEKKAMQVQRKSSSGKDFREIEASLERAKKEREAFRQRCEKSEILQKNLQEENSSLKNELEVREKELGTSSHKEIGDGGRVREKSSSDDGYESLELRGLVRAHSRISQLKEYVTILEHRVKEKDESISFLRKENARANDVVMEKSLELSKSRRMLERKIERLTNENSELRRRTLSQSSYSKPRGGEETGSKQTGSKQPPEDKTQPETSQLEVVEARQRRRSNPERSVIETALKRLNNESNDVSSRSAGNQVDKPDDQDSGRSTLNIPLDVTPRRRIGGKFTRASSKRHSADLGKLMSRPEPVISKRIESDMLHEDEPATIFINKYRKKSEEEEHWV